MVSSCTSGVDLSSANNSVVTSRVVVSDSDVARDGDATLPSDRQSYSAEDEGGTRVNGATTGAIEWNESGPPSLSMSVDLHNLVNPSNLQDSGHYSASPEHVDASAAGCNATNLARTHDEEESYEAFGSVEGDADDGVDSPGGSSSAPSPTGTNSLRNPRSPNSTIGRHSWLRTSLRRTPPCSGRKRLSTNALASQLYRSGSFNSSGRGSNCDPADDMYSDVSLEEDVIDLNHRMCASNTPHCRPPPRPGSSAEDHHVENGRFHQQHPAHQPPYIYYPPPVPYPPLNPYGPYGPYHSGGYYSHPYCTEPTQEPKSSGTSLIGVILFVLLILCVISVVLYRLLPRESRRRLDARLPILTHPPVQTRKTKRDANQNFPAEFLVFSKVNRSREKVSCEGCEDDSVSFCDADECQTQGIIEISTMKKVNAGTDTIESTGTRSTGT